MRRRVAFNIILISFSALVLALVLTLLTIGLFLGQTAKTELLGSVNALDSTQRSVLLRFSEASGSNVLTHRDGQVLFSSGGAEDEWAMSLPPGEHGTLTDSGRAVAVVQSRENGVTLCVYRLLPGPLGVPDELASVLIVLYVALLVAVILAARFRSALAIRPLTDLGSGRPLRGKVDQELEPILTMLGTQSTQITTQMKTIKSRQDAFSSITEHMSEALVVLDSRGLVTSVNQSALHLFEADPDDCLGRHVEFLTRSRPVLDAVEEARAGYSIQHAIEMGDKHYQLIVNPVLSGEQAGGVILLLLDITESYESEQMRREFTANVTHELKTPLTSIAGYAEIIRENLAKPEDITSFAGRIHDESKRLLSMIDDILALAQLDETSPTLPAEPVELLALTREVTARLEPQAEEKGVTIVAAGTPTTVKGVRSLIDEMIYNLCDNAIKYNRKGGNISISVFERDGKSIVSVADTGIGIPVEDQRRVFERFFRVDKSHSKQTGGTGLGLSIVKHAAIYHSAKIELASRPGTGTLIRIIFPKQDT